FLSSCCCVRGGSLAPPGQVLREAHGRPRPLRRLPPLPGAFRGSDGGHLQPPDLHLHHLLGGPGGPPRRGLPYGVAGGRRGGGTAAGGVVAGHSSVSSAGAGAAARTASTRSNGPGSRGRTRTAAGRGAVCRASSRSRKSGQSGAPRVSDIGTQLQVVAAPRRA